MSNPWSQLPTLPKLPGMPQTGAGGRPITGIPTIPTLGGGQPGGATRPSVPGLGIPSIPQIPTLPQMPTVPSLPGQTQPGAVTNASSNTAISTGSPANSATGTANTFAVPVPNAPSQPQFTSGVLASKPNLGGVPGPAGAGGSVGTGQSSCERTSARPAPMLPNLNLGISPTSSVAASATSSLQGLTTTPPKALGLGSQPQTAPTQAQAQSSQQQVPMGMGMGLGMGMGMGMGLGTQQQQHKPLQPQPQPLQAQPVHQQQPRQQQAQQRPLDFTQELPTLNDLDISFNGPDSFGDLSSFDLDMDSKIDQLQTDSKMSAPSTASSMPSGQLGLSRLSAVPPIQVPPNRSYMQGDAFPDPDGNSSPSAPLVGLSGQIQSDPVPTQQSQQAQQTQSASNGGGAFGLLASAAKFIIGGGSSSSSNNSNTTSSNGLAPSSVSFGGGPTLAPSTSNAIPQQPHPTGTGLTEENEPPLLEELGIDIPLIIKKTKQVVFPSHLFSLKVCRRQSPETEAAQTAPVDDASDPMSSDLAGPLVFCLVLGVLLLFTGKVHFGYIYGFGLTGCVLMYIILNLLSHSSQSVSFDRTMHIFGYCLPPVLLLSFVSIFADLRGPLGHAFSALMIFWSTVIATSYIERILDMRQQRYLVAYPVALFYACFAMLAVF